jgi:hypothetical protein
METREKNPKGPLSQTYAAKCTAFRKHSYLLLFAENMIIALKFVLHQFLHMFVKPILAKLMKKWGVVGGN